MIGFKIDMVRGYPGLMAQYAEYRKFYEQQNFVGTQVFSPEILEPRPEWSGRTVNLLSSVSADPIIFRFFDKKPRIYHIIKRSAIVEV